MDKNTFESKLKRIASGEPVRVLDLFSGCGGMTLGFLRANCVSMGGVEIDPYAAMSHATNFHANATKSQFTTYASPKDITKVTPEELLSSYGHKNHKNAIDVLVGGPPCPTFTRVGRAKLREVQQHPEAFLHDPRAQLYLPYLQYVEALKPVALLMENVPDFLNWGGHNLAEEICETLEDLGYQCIYTLVNASNYGVPQMRERFILLAVHSAAGSSPSFPTPLNAVDFPSGYTGTRDVALKHLRNRSLLAPSPRYVETPSPPPHAKPPVTVHDAIADLPPITGHLTGEIRKGARRFDKGVPYAQGVVPTEYARMMRDWPGFEGGLIWDHVIRSLSDRDYRLFRHMEHGNDYPKAHALASRLFNEAIVVAQQCGLAPEEGTPEYAALQSQFIPPYDPGKFPNKWRKMEPHLPARTLMAHLGKDSYSHIHYDSEQSRTISVREAARLQSFPDGFKFCGTMNPAFRQIGNAVPPVLAFELAKSLLACIRPPSS